MTNVPTEDPDRSLIEVLVDLREAGMTAVRNAASGDYADPTFVVQMLRETAELSKQIDQLRRWSAPEKHRTTVRAESAEDAFIRAQRQERERVTVGGQSMPGLHETIMTGFIDGLSKDVPNETGEQWVERIARRVVEEHARESGPHRKVLDEYMRALDAKPRNCTPGLDLPLDERTARAFGLDHRTYNRYAAGLADALDIPQASATAVIDGLALVVGDGS